MRTALVPLLLAPLAFAVPDTLAAFEPALEQLPTSSNDTTPVDSIAELLRRQNNNCANNYYQCANAASLCCPRTAICTADRNNVVGCCPQGATCTGTLGASATGVGPASTTNPFVTASTTSGPFVQATTGPASGASTVSNAFYPFPYIATTYSNAAACSSAYTRCQSDAASCTEALIAGAQGVAISAPNGGATITAVPSLGPQSASSICSSLSQQACYGLQVEACRAFDGSGNAAATRCGGYMGAVGVALGVAGQLL